MVPRAGLEPAHLAAEDFESSVSTYFTIWAKKLFLIFKESFLFLIFDKIKTVFCYYTIFLWFYQQQKFFFLVFLVFLQLLSPKTLLYKKNLVCQVFLKKSFLIFEFFNCAYFHNHSFGLLVVQIQTKQPTRHRDKFLNRCELNFHSVTRNWVDDL